MTGQGFRHSSFTGGTFNFLIFDHSAFIFCVYRASSASRFVSNTAILPKIAALDKQTKAGVGAERIEQAQRVASTASST